MRRYRVPRNRMDSAYYYGDVTGEVYPLLRGGGRGCTGGTEGTGGKTITGRQATLTKKHFDKSLFDPQRKEALDAKKKSRQRYFSADSVDPPPGPALKSLMGLYEKPPIHDERRLVEAAGGLCVDLGDKKRSYPPPPSLTEFQYLVRKIKREELNRDGKLVLICDLDGTLMETTTDYLARWVKDIIPMNPLYMKLRPGLQNFLLRMSQAFELIACSTGMAEYTAQTVHILDPKREYFKGRIFYRELFQKTPVNSKMEIMTHLEHVEDMVIAIDDKPMFSEKYWLPVERYQPFRTRDACFPSGFYLPHITMAPHYKWDIEENKNYLQFLDHWLITTRDRYYGYTAPNLPQIVGKYSKPIHQFIRSLMTTYEPAPATDKLVEMVQGLTRDYLIQQQKLILVVDADKCIVDYTKDDNAEYYLQKQQEARGDYYIMKRPHTLSFLSRLGTFYELVFVTAGNKDYAAAVMSVLKPIKTTKVNRIFSKEDIADKVSVLKLIPESSRDLAVILTSGPREKWPELSVVVNISRFKMFVSPTMAFSKRTWTSFPKVIPKEGVSISINDHDLFMMKPTMDLSAFFVNLNELCYKDPQNPTQIPFAIHTLKSTPRCRDWPTSKRRRTGDLAMPGPSSRR